jgi:hypothetical protein
VKTFRTLVVLKHPHEAVWAAMRDRLPEFAPRIPDIASVTQTERDAVDGGSVRIVNEWRIRLPVPAAVRSIIGADEIGWIDRNTWDERTRTCSWTIEPFFLAEYIACDGRTVFEPAMGGRGARISLEGTLDLKPGFLGRLAGAAERPITGFLESAVTTVIPKNLRAVVEAAAAFSAESPSGLAEKAIGAAGKPSGSAPSPSGSTEQHAVVEP